MWLTKTVGASLNAYNDMANLFGDQPRSPTSAGRPVECVLVIDTGYSHTTVTPVYEGRPIQQAIRRLDIGGKFLTNYMKETLSVRQMDVRDETYLVNQMKEDACYVSTAFKNDLESVGKGPLTAGRKPPVRKEDIVVDFVLPDYTTRMRGELRTHDPTTMAMRTKLGAVTGPDGKKEYIMALGNERFMVPELLFSPRDIGMKQAGLAETVLLSLSGLPPSLWPSMLANILVVGGNAKFAGFENRLYVLSSQPFMILTDQSMSEIRQLAPAECVVRITIAPEYVIVVDLAVNDTLILTTLSPIKSTWLGGARLAFDKAALKDIMVTKQEYQEHGSTWLLKKFSGGSTK